MFKITAKVRSIYYPVPEFRSWNLGEEKPYERDSVAELHASGEELRFIEQQFRGIPTVMRKETVIWRGVYAQFIYDNL